MKTNFLYFRENGSQEFVATAAQTNFTINGDANWDVDVTADTQVKVTVTFKAAQTTKVGSAYSGGAVDAGETVTVNNTGKSLSGNDIVITAQTADGTNGITISAGDIVNISLIPAETTEFALRADHFIACNAASDTSTVLSFKASNGSDADDSITFTHADDNGATFINIAKAMASILNANKLKAGAVVTVYDKQNNVFAEGLGSFGITNMACNIA
tara:strand:- start:51 stop:695 length:645 start_codon:yes stop_codon:yes gene_type:complete